MHRHACGDAERRTCFGRSGNGGYSATSSSKGKLRMIVSLFYGLGGRINRAKWWLGSLILLVVGLFLFMFIGAVFGVRIFGDRVSIEKSVGAITAAQRSWLVLSLVITAIAAYPTTTLMLKRLHDRDRPGWLVCVFWTPAAVNIVKRILVLGYDTMDVGRTAMLVPAALKSIFAFVIWAVTLWSLVEMGCLKGTSGTNRYGPDPLGSRRN
jgi:uncharacterized membrane protein YhaH (DUF805 family)